MVQTDTRREFLRRLGISGAALPFVWNLPSLGHAAAAVRKQRLVIMFSPNGVIPDQFWPAEEGADFRLPEILKSAGLLPRPTVPVEETENECKSEDHGG